MAASTATCQTCAGPTIRVRVDTVTGTVGLSLTLEQALDLFEQLRLEFAKNNIPYIDIPE